MLKVMTHVRTKNTAVNGRSTPQQGQQRLRSRGQQRLRARVDDRLQLGHLLPQYRTCSRSSVAQLR